jgi:hypothetical protein
MATINDIFQAITYFLKNYGHIAVAGALFVKFLHGLEAFAKAYEAWVVFKTFTKSSLKPIFTKTYWKAKLKKPTA